MKKKIIIEELFIHGLSHELRGIGTHDGKKIFVEGAWKGETVSVEIQRKKTKHSEGRALVIKDPSKERITPLCPSAMFRAELSVCGGCSLQHIQISSQREAKEAIVRELLREALVSFPQCSWEAPLIGKDFGYRRKARLSVNYSPKEDKVYLGFRERWSHRVTRMTHCPILVPEVDKILPALFELLNQMEAKSSVAQVEVAVGNQEDGSKDVAFSLRRMSPWGEKDIKLLEDFFKECGARFYIDDGKGPVLNSPNPSPLKFLDLPSSLSLSFEPSDFIQIHDGLNQPMVQQAIDWLAPKENEKIVDAFCGIGNFTLPLSLHSKEVLGLEWSASMTQKLQDNLVYNLKNNPKMRDNIQGKSLDLTDSKAIQPLLKTLIKEQFELLVLDPPRSGADVLIEALPLWAPQRILYISCNPVTLARDTKALIAQGYQPKKCGIMDLFPHTKHIETMVLFEKGL